MTQTNDPGVKFSSLRRPPDTEIVRPQDPRNSKAGKFIGRTTQFTGYLHGDEEHRLVGERLEITDAGTDRHGNLVFRVATRFGSWLDHGGSTFCYPDELGMRMKARKLGQGGRPLPDGPGFTSGVWPNPVVQMTKSIIGDLVRASEDWAFWS